MMFSVFVHLPPNDYGVREVSTYDYVYEENVLFLGQKQPLTTLSVPTKKKTLTCTPYIRSFAQDYSQFSFGCSLFVLIRETIVVMRYSDSIGIEYGVCFEFFFLGSVQTVNLHSSNFYDKEIQSIHL